MDAAAAFDLDALEERLVDLSPQDRVRVEVRRVCVLEELQARDEVGLAGVVCSSVTTQAIADLVLQEVERDRFGVVSLLELVALGVLKLVALDEALTLDGRFLSHDFGSHMPGDSSPREGACDGRAVVRNGHLGE